MTPNQKAELLKQAIPPEHVHDLLRGRGIARRSGSWGNADYEGIHNREGLIPWRDVHGIVSAGTGEGRRAVYAAALDEYWRWMESSGRGHLSEADKAERLVWRDRVNERLRETAWAIIDAGCERYAAPEPLFEMGGL
jgi:hypothetical protein